MSTIYIPIDVDWLKTHMSPDSHSLSGYQTAGGLKIFTSVDHGRRHLSISHTKRYPTWDEIKDARDMFLPIGKHFVMALPSSQHYVNEHPHCFHLWECLPDREKDLIWTFEQG